MKYLIDTQIFIWFQLHSRNLSDTVLQMLTNPDNTIYVSQISLFEIAIKQKIGKIPELDVPVQTLVSLLESDGFVVLPLANVHLATYDAIPLLAEHRDPFDRLLMATSVAERIPFITADGQARLYQEWVEIVMN